MGSRVYRTNRSDFLYTSEEDTSLPNLEQLKRRLINRFQKLYPGAILNGTEEMRLPRQYSGLCILDSENKFFLRVGCHVLTLRNQTFLDII